MLDERRKRGRVSAEPSDPQRTRRYFRSMVSIDKSIHLTCFIRRAGCHTNWRFPRRCQILLHNTNQPHYYHHCCCCCCCYYYYCCCCCCCYYYYYYYTYDYYYYYYQFLSLSTRTATNTITTTTVAAKFPKTYLISKVFS